MPRVREPFESEVKWFRSNPEVAGMASYGDGSVVLNPFSNLSESEKAKVIENEGIRLWQNQNKVKYGFDVTPEQEASFKGTAYEGKADALRETIVGRILSGDPSAGFVTPEQSMAAEWTRQIMGGKGDRGTSVIGPDGSRYPMSPEVQGEANRMAMEWIVNTERLLERYPVESGVTEPVQGGVLDVLRATKRAWWDAPVERLGIWQKGQASKWKNYIDELKRED